MVFAVENIKKIKPKEILFIFTVSLITSVFIYLNQWMFSSTISLIISLIFIAIGINLLVNILKKSGVAIIFNLFVGILTFNQIDLGFIGFKKILILVLAGLVFEIAFLVLKLHIFSIPLDLVIGTSISFASIYLIAGFILSANLASNFPTEMINLILLTFLVGLFGSFLAYLIWNKIKITRLVLEIESYMYVLGRGWKK